MADELPDIAVIRGTLQPQLQRYTGRYSPTSGWTYDQEFRGLSPQLMQNLASVYAFNGCSYELTVEYGIATLRTTDNRGEVSIDVWEIGVSEVLIPPWKNPRNLATIDTKTLALIKFTMDKGLLPADAVSQFNSSPELVAMYGDVTWPDNASVVSSDIYALRLYERMHLLGEEGVFVQMYVLRHTTNVSNRWPYNVADYNKNCIYTPAQFFSEVQNSQNWLFPMPNAFRNVLNSNPALDGPPVGFKNYNRYLWGYLKGGSPRGTAANNRSNIVTEYKQYLWSMDEYGTV